MKIPNLLSFSHFCHNNPISWVGLGEIHLPKSPTRTPGLLVSMLSPGFYAMSQREIDKPRK